MTSVRFMFVRNENNHPVGCLAIRINNGFVEYQASTLNPVDTFNRKLARDIAEGRLNQHPVRLPYTGIASMNEITRAVMLDVERNKAVPTRLAKAARQWLVNKYF
jgi:hypothetical protein